MTFTPEQWLLLSLLLIPGLGAFLCGFITERFAKTTALAISLLGLLPMFYLWSAFDSEQASSFQMALSLPWIESLQIRFALGLDGLSLPLILLTKIMVPIAILSSFSEKRHLRAFMACFLILDLAMTGTFLATDIFLFYVFWELMLLPMLLLIGVWGSSERIFASLKFFIYTFSGSILMLVAILWIFAAHKEQMGYYSADIQNLYRIHFPVGEIFWGLQVQDLVFLALTLSFAIKIPLFPLHTWLPDAHVQAPTGGSVLLAAVLLKMGAYGLLRFSIPMAPLSFEKFVPMLAVLSLIGILYGAWVSYQQSDMKKLIAYSSVSHLGFVMLGICANNEQALAGSMLQMINHGISTGALFILVGILYERRHTRNISDFGGLAKVIPNYALALVFVAFSSMAVPGLNGFVGEFLILLGTFQTSKIWAGIAVLGVFFGALYLLSMLKNVLFGPITHEENRQLMDLTLREKITLLPLCALIIFLGVYPQPFLRKFDKALVGSPVTLSRSPVTLLRSRLHEIASLVTLTRNDSENGFTQPMRKGLSLRRSGATEAISLHLPSNEKKPSNDKQASYPKLTRTADNTRSFP